LASQTPLKNGWIYDYSENFLLFKNNLNSVLKRNYFAKSFFKSLFLGSAAPAIFGLNLYLSANFLKNSFNDTFVSLQEFFNKFARNLKIYLRKSRSGKPLAKLLGFCFGKKICAKPE
jgi:hypothetical protein